MASWLISGSSTFGEKAHELAIAVDRATARLRGPRTAALRTQITRAAGSIPANIVEGNGQQTPREFRRYVRYAINSASEVEYDLILARDTTALPTKVVDPLLERVVEIRKMLYGLLAYLSRLDRARREQPP